MQGYIWRSAFRLIFSVVFCAFAAVGRGEGQLEGGGFFNKLCKVLDLSELPHLPCMVQEVTARSGSFRSNFPTVDSDATKVCGSAAAYSALVMPRSAFAMFPFLLCLSMVSPENAERELYRGVQVSGGSVGQGHLCVPQKFLAEALGQSGSDAACLLSSTGIGKAAARLDLLHANTFGFVSIKIKFPVVFVPASCWFPIQNSAHQRHLQKLSDLAVRCRGLVNLELKHVFFLNQRVSVQADWDQYSLICLRCLNLQKRHFTGKVDFSNPLAVNSCRHVLFQLSACNLPIVMPAMLVLMASTTEVFSVDGYSVLLQNDAIVGTKRHAQEVSIMLMRICKSCEIITILLMNYSHMYEEWIHGQGVQDGNVKAFLFGLIHRQRVRAWSLLVPKFNGKAVRSLGSVKLIFYLQLRSIKP